MKGLNTCLSRPFTQVVVNPATLRDELQQHLQDQQQQQLRDELQQLLNQQQQRQQKQVQTQLHEEQKQQRQEQKQLHDRLERLEQALLTYPHQVRVANISV